MDVLPNAEHRWCARHIYANWSKKWHGVEMKKRFFICAWRTYEEEFKDNLKTLGEVNKKAAEDLLKYSPSKWYRAYFSSRCTSDIVDNNMSESFNASTLNARFKPIVSMLDDIRHDAMTRLGAHKQDVEKWRNEWSPQCMEKFHDNMSNAFGCHVFFNGDEGYEIINGNERHTVF